MNTFSYENPWCTLCVLQSPGGFRCAAGQNNNNSVYSTHRKVLYNGCWAFPKGGPLCTNAAKTTPEHTLICLFHSHVSVCLCRLCSWKSIHADQTPTRLSFSGSFSHHLPRSSPFPRFFPFYTFFKSNFVRYSGHILGRWDDVAVLVRVQDLGKVTGHRVCILSDVDLRQNNMQLDPWFISFYFWKKSQKSITQTESLNEPNSASFCSVKLSCHPCRASLMCSLHIRFYSTRFESVQNCEHPDRIKKV